MRLKVWPVWPAEIIANNQVGCIKKENIPIPRLLSIRTHLD